MIRLACWALGLAAAALAAADARPMAFAVAGAAASTPGWYRPRITPDPPLEFIEPDEQRVRDLNADLDAVSGTGATIPVGGLDNRNEVNTHVQSVLRTQSS